MQLEIRPGCSPDNIRICGPGNIRMNAHTWILKNFSEREAWPVWVEGFIQVSFVGNVSERKQYFLDALEKQFQ